MNNYIIPIIISSIAGLSTMLGSLVINFKPKNINRFIAFFLAFSISIMIGISIFDLIPNAFKMIITRANLSTFIFIFSGSFILVHLFFKVINNIEYKLKEKGSKLYKLGIISMIVLIFHNFPEGIATFLSSYTNISLGIKLSIAIMLHNIPEGICIAVPIYYATKSKKKALKYTFYSGISEPIGAILSMVFLRNYVNEFIINSILLFVGVLMIYLSIEKIYPTIKEYNDNRSVIYGLIVGLILIITSILL